MNRRVLLTVLVLCPCLAGSPVLHAQRLVPDSLRIDAPAFSLPVWDPWSARPTPRLVPDSARPQAPTASLPLWGADSKRSESLGVRDLRGQVVVLDFWSRYCRPCIPIHEALVERAPAWQQQGVRVVSILTWDVPAGLTEFLQDHGGPPPFPILLDSAGTFLKAFDGYGLPTVAILDHRGRVAWKHLGGFSAAVDLPRLLPPLLAARDGRALPRDPNRLTY